MLVLPPHTDAPGCSATHFQQTKNFLHLTGWLKTLNPDPPQKPLNVFLKVYVDWASQPTGDLAQALRSLLHVPLDSLLMEFIAREFPDEYQSRIVPLRHRLAEWLASGMEKATPKMVSRSWGGEFSLTGIVVKEMYLAWQEMLRSLYPGKPVTLDTIWVLERARIRASGNGVPVGDERDLQ